MRNRYPAKCCRCGKRVEPDDGFMLGDKVTHEKCVPVVDLTGRTLGAEIDGRYANTLRFLKD